MDNATAVSEATQLQILTRRYKALEATHEKTEAILASQRELAEAQATQIKNMDAELDRYRSESFRRSQQYKEPDIPFKGMTIMDLWREYKEVQTRIMRLENCLDELLETEDEEGESD